MKIQKHIEIVRSNTLGLSSMSGVSSRAIQAILKRTYATVNISLVNNFNDLQSLVAKRPDLVFVGMKFVPSDTSVSIWDSSKIWVTEFLDENEIAYTGSDYLAHALELDKSLAKQRVLSAGFLTSPFTVVDKTRDIPLSSPQLTYPLFVKPTNRGGGIGIDNDSLVYTHSALQAKIRTLSDDFNADALVEEYLPGREFSVAIIKDEDTEDYLLMPLELIAPANKQGVRILSAAIKSADTEKFIAVSDEILRSSVTELALGAFNALGGRDYGRIDVRLDQFGVPHFLEANLIPSLLDGYGNFPKACMLNLGIDYESMIHRIVSLGFARFANEYSTLMSSTSLVPLSASL